MTETVVLELSRDAVFMMMMLGAPILGASLIVGLMVGLFQAVTQINEATLTFVPKLLAVGTVVVLLGPWMLGQLIQYLANTLMSLPDLVR